MYTVYTEYHFFKESFLKPQKYIPVYNFVAVFCAIFTIKKNPDVSDMSIM